MTAVHGSVPRERQPRGQGPEPVEREGELALFVELTRRTAAGDPALVMLEGPDGIGKTTLLRALIAQARAEELRVVHTTAGQEGERLPLSTAHTLLAGLDADVGQKPLTAWTHVDRTPLTAWTRPPDPAGGNARSRGLACYDVDGENPSFGVLAELHEVVRSAAADSPLVIVVDDSEEADTASLRFLAHTARRLAGLPVLLALARRSGADEPALNDVAALPLCRLVRPRPLTSEGIGLLTLRLLGSETDAAFQESCLAATNGNPLLATRLLTALREERLPLTADHVASVPGQDIHGFRLRAADLLHRHPAVTVQAARALAVLGDRVTPENGARLALLDSPVFARSLLALVSGGLVTSNSDGSWSFSHALLRNVVLGDMSDDERDALHGRAARLLHDDGASPSDVAEHLCHAPSTARQPWAAAILRDAAREAVLRASPVRAVELLRACVPEDAEEAGDPSLLLELGVAEMRVDAEASVRHLTAALEGATEPKLRLEALGVLAEALTRQGQVGRAAVLLARCRSEAASTASGSADPQLMEAQLLIAASANRAAYTELLQTVSFDLSLPGDTPEQRALLATRAVISASRMDRVAEAVAAARTVVRRSTATTDAPVFLGAAASGLLYADLPHEAEVVYQRLVIGVDALLDPGYRNLLALRAEAHQRLGALGEASRASTAALAGMTGARATPFEALALAVRLHTLLDQGDLAQATLLEAGIPDPVQDDCWQWNEVVSARGRLWLAKEDPTRALAHFEECARMQAGWQRTSPAVSPWWYWAGRTHLALGDRASAVALAERAVADARSAGLPCALGSGLELWAATMSDDRRPALLEEAEQVLMGTRAALWLARVRVARGQALQRLGYKKAAREVLRQGWEEAYGVGSLPLHTVAHRALLATGARPRRPVSRGPGALTQSESQVARLAADGRSNAYIAETLFVTRRTVEVHLTSVYRKLGLTGRRELRDSLESQGLHDAGHGQ
ncbi:DNA-binding CsgD family transcriptional regulator/tetratricopeptide (TPR) repeat protein [Streptomyces achromogenes]|uniref:DNA-binding CsgD family transcriptional regulator/tetratricopeptide (TPR) repeat protein n=1 Tax=Streptomyces achromogenes TaxID=67255 RepID=A0ABU0QBG6_STRAH|nr:LuxR family transcriptional regulator [Streptomyces achromogenes]MDQ0688011.1 DNA-binding CsgD family transcriptional regulator/tetratricopeptide (TPR) repeat protein [Streptomyces achromogenes]